MARNQRRPGGKPEAPTTNHATDTIAPSVDGGKYVATLTLDELVTYLRAELFGGVGRDWIGQAASPLGRGRHCAATKRRVASGLPGARIVGRRHELSPGALSEELQTLSRRKVPAVAKTEPSNVISDLERELRAVGK